MQIETIEAQWIDAGGDCSVRELAQLAGVSPSLIESLVEHGALTDDAVERAASVTIVRSVRRLQDDFDLDANGLAVALSLLRRVQVLERELLDLRALAIGIVER